MRKHLSIVMLAARESLYKLLALLLAAAVVQLGLFYMAVRANGTLGFERLAANSGMAPVFALAFLLTAALLCLQNAGSGCGCTLRRLRVSERAACLWFGVYNCAAFFLLWAAELAVVFAAAEIYTALAPAEYQSPQTLFLAFYRQRFLHSLLPLADWTRLLRNICLVLSLGISCAHFPYALRRGRRDAAAVAVVMLALVFFPGKMANPLGDAMLAALLLWNAVRCALDFGRGEADEA